MSIITHFTPTLSWADASAAFLAAYGAEKLYDDLVWTPAFQAVADDDARRIPQEVTNENERLTNVRCEAENVWVAALAPDMAGVIMKIEYARRRWEDCEDWPPAWWNAGRRNPEPITPDRIEAARMGMAKAAVTDILADMILGRMDAVESVSDLLRLAALRLHRRVDEL